MYRQPSLSRKYVYSLSDFPAPQDLGDGYGTAIHLEDKVEYILQAQILSPYEFILPLGGGSKLKSTAVEYALVYVGSGYMFRQSILGTVVAESMVISCPFGTVFDIDTVHTLAYTAQTVNFTVGQVLTGALSGATATIIADDDQGTTGTLTIAGTSGRFYTGETITDALGGSATSATANTTLSILYMHAVIFNGISAMGTFKAAGFNFHTSQIIDCGNGLILDSNEITVLGNISFNDWKNNSTSFITIRGYHNSIQFNNAFGVPKSNETILDIESTSSFLALTITGSTMIKALSGDIFAANSRDQKDIYIVSTGNSGLADSTISIEATYTGSPYGTISILAQDAKTLINLSGWAEEESERLTLDTTGYAVYNGLEAATIALDGNIHASQDLGANQILICAFIRIQSSNGSYTVTFDNTADIVVETATERVNGDVISFKNSTSTLPAALSKNILYYVVNKTTNSFQLSYTSGGAAITFADNGTGTHTYELVDFHGSEATVSVDSNLKQVDFIPQGLMSLKTNDQIYLYIQNTSSANDVRIYKGFYRIKK